MSADLVWLIDPQGKRVSATAEDARGMVEHCGYHYENEPEQPAISELNIVPATLAVDSDVTGLSEIISDTPNDQDSAA
jgi:hypothetical protein